MAAVLFLPVAKVTTSSAIGFFSFMKYQPKTAAAVKDRLDKTGRDCRYSESGKRCLQHLYTKQIKMRHLWQEST